MERDTVTPFLGIPERVYDMRISVMRLHKYSLNEIPEVISGASDSGSCALFRFLLLGTDKRECSIKHHTCGIVNSAMYE